MKPAFATAVLALTTTIALAACSAGGTPSFTQPEAQLVTRAEKKPLVYISLAAANSVAVFQLDGKRIGTIATDVNYPQGIFVDARGTLYVANRGSNDVLEFKRGASTPFKILRDGQRQPEGVAVCPNGTVYVANIGGDIAVYAHGSRTPTGKLTYDGGGVFFFATCDAQGNVFATLVLGTTGTVAEFPGGHQKGATQLPIFFGGNPAGIQADSAGNLLVAGQGDGVEEFTEAGQPTGLQITTVGLNEITLSPDGTLLLGASTKGGLQYTFPGGTLDHTYRTHGGNPIGAAVSP